MRKSLIVLSVLSALAGLHTSQALAEDAAAAAPASPHTFTANVGFVSDYRYRGISQTEKKAALQGGMDYSHESGVYVGTWASNVSWFDDFNPSSSNSLEWDFYGGYKGTAGPIGYDIGLLQYYYPGSDVSTAGVPSPNTLEAYLGLSWEFLTFKYSYSFSNLFGFVDSKGSQYYDLSASYDVWEGFIVGAHFGRQSVANNSKFSYNDWKIGVTKEVLGVNVGLAYVDTDTDKYTSASGKQNWGHDTFVLSVNKTF
jgi:uncharacterized protein (TIGR02001 family)